jgi:hypothetical protein
LTVAGFQNILRAANREPGSPKTGIQPGALRREE